MKIKQTDMVARLQTNRVDISIYSYNRIEKAHKIQLYYFCMPVVVFCYMNIIFDFQSLNRTVLGTYFRV